MKSAILLALGFAYLSLCYGAIFERLDVISRSVADPPPVTEAALMARYVIHNSDWLSIATISIQDNIAGYPFVSLKSFCDGPLENSTGIPYLYLTDMDVSGKDILQNNSVSIMTTLAQSDYCKEKEYDPQDPRCAKVLISGKVQKIDESSEEYTFGKQSLFARHPAMRDWPESHGFYVAKVKLEQILVLDTFGGLKGVTVDEYFSANVTGLVNLTSYFQRVSVIAIGGTM